MKSTYRDIKYALCIVWRINKNVYFLNSILLCWGVLYSLINIWVPAKIINFIYPVFQLERVIFLIAILCFSLIFNGIICGKLRDVLSILEMNITAKVKADYAKVMANLPYEKIQQTQMLDDIEFTKKGISKGCEFQVVISVFAMVQSIISIVFILGILSQLSFIYFLVTILVTVSETVVKSIVEKKRFEFDVNHENTSRKLNYAIWGLTDCSLGKEVRLFSLMDYVQNKFNKERTSMYRDLTGRTRILAKYYFLPSFLLGVLYLSVYGLAAYSMFVNKMDPGDFVLFTSGILSFHQLLTIFADNVITIRERLRYIERCRILSMLAETGKEKIDIDITNIKIEFQHVWFKYPNQTNFALRDICFTLSGKEKIAIVGKNGSGKSTFIKLMIGFYKPVKGNILINGVSIEKISKNSLKAIFAPVFQDYYLTAYSVRENLMFCDSQHNDALIHTVLHQVGVDEAVKQLPGVLDCAMSKKIDEKGCDLSGGESQKIALARAILKNCPVFILDEPTAALSPSAEYEIYENFKDISENKATIFISHRMAACKLCDRILVFHDGEIAEEGTHTELMALNGAYRNMFDTQSNYYKET